MTFLQVMGCDLCIRNDVASPGSRRSFGRVFARENHQSLDLKYWALVRKRTYLGWGAGAGVFPCAPGRSVGMPSQSNESHPTNLDGAVVKRQGLPSTNLFGVSRLGIWLGLSC